MSSPLDSTLTKTHFLLHAAVPQATLWWQWWPHRCHSESGPWTAGWRALAGSGWSPGSSPCSADPGEAGERRAKGERWRGGEERVRVMEVEVRKKSTLNGREPAECSVASSRISWQTAATGFCTTVTGNRWRAFTDLQAVEEVGGRR